MQAMLRPLCLSIVLSSPEAALADLTADQVWQSWQDVAASAGLTLAADATARDGAALRLTGVTVAPLGGKQLKIAQIVLTEAADGSVSAAFPEAVALILGPGAGTAGMSLVQEGMTVILREGEAPGAMAYDISADRIEGSYSAKDGDHAQGNETILNVGWGLHGVTMQATAMPGDLVRTLLDLKARSLDYSIGSTSQVLESGSQQTNTSADVAITLDLSVPLSMPILAMTGPADIAQALRDGLAARMTFAQGETIQTDRTIDPFLNYDLKITARPGASVLTLDRSGMAIEGEASGGAIAGTVGEMPKGAFEATFGAFELLFRVPLIGGDAEDFAIRLGVNDVVLGDGVWSLFDAGGAFPRDAASLNLDMSGKARLDLLGLAADDLAGRSPDPAKAPEILSLDLRNVAVAMAGAALSGQGAFTFATGTDGVPVPDGRASFALTGANALLDRAVAAGIASQDDVGGARMMLGMFMRPAAGEDSLTSEIEAAADGSVTVNGMRLR